MKLKLKCPSCGKELDNCKLAGLGKTIVGVCKSCDFYVRMTSYQDLLKKLTRHRVRTCGKDPISPFSKGYYDGMKEASAWEKLKDTEMEEPENFNPSER